MLQGFVESEDPVYYFRRMNKDLQKLIMLALRYDQGSGRGECARRSKSVFILLC